MVAVLDETYDCNDVCTISMCLALWPCIYTSSAPSFIDYIRVNIEDVSDSVPG